MEKRGTYLEGSFVEGLSNLLWVKLNYCKHPHLGLNLPSLMATYKDPFWSTTRISNLFIKVNSQQTPEKLTMW